MTLPGVTVESRESPPSASTRIESGTWFVAGPADRGVVGSETLVRNLAQFTREYGERQSYSTLYDALDVFFREGGSRAYVSRVVGPDPVLATVTLEDAAGTPVDTLRVDAVSPGAWGNDLDVTVVSASGSFTLTVLEDSAAVEISPTFANNAEAVTWALSSDYIRLTDLGGGDPASGTFSLASGDDDRLNATNTTWEDALNVFDHDLGPGQVSLPGRTTGQAHTDLLQHAEDRNRVALIDLADSGDAVTLASAAATARAISGSERGAAFAPWGTAPGIASGTTRTVPWSAFQAGIIARNDQRGLSPNVAAAGENGISRYAVGLSQDPWDANDREDLNDAGVNVVRTMKNTIRTYGYRSLIDPDNPAWLQFTNGRMRMELVARSEVIGEKFVFAQIDGRGFKTKEYEGELTAMLLEYYDAGSLFGDTPRDAFFVDTGDSVNSIESLADGELRAVEYVRMSPFAERVAIEIVKIANTEVIA